MKSLRFLVLMSGILILLTTGCAKKVVENQASTDQDVATEAPMASQSDDSTQTAVNDQAGQDDTAALDQLLNAYVYFDFDSAVLRPDAQAVLQQKVQWLQSNPDLGAIVIEGHCDERGTDAYNMALGARRAEAVKEYLKNLGCEPSKFQILSYGEERPMDMGHNEEAWSKNRRANFVLN